MIVYKQGDVVQALLDGEVTMLIHQTNCQGVMGSGIARQIKEKIPNAYKEYKDSERRNGGLYLGGVTIGMVATPKGDGYVFNVNGQDEYQDRLKCNTNYAYLAKGLIGVIDYATVDDIIAMPKIGAGLGGGDWKIIEALIESAFEGRTVYVYTLEEPKKYSKRNDIA
jgi:O-acetyl-ADP-ribose deacetylase (regulator of RNase III)